MSLTDRGLVAFLLRHYVIKDMEFESSRGPTAFLFLHNVIKDMKFKFNGQASCGILIKALRH